MAGLLGLHFENAEEETRVSEAELGGLDESETASAAVEEIVSENAEVADADAEAEDLGERVDLAEELHDEVEPVVTEGNGYDRAGMALLLVNLRRVAGRDFKHLVGKGVNMEAIGTGVTSRREQTRLQFETIQETLKQAWEAIKSAFKKAWAKVKSWFVKTFDGSKKIKARAEKLRKRAETGSATIDKNKFNFGGAKQLAIGNKLKASEFIAGLGAVKKASDALLDKVKNEAIDDAADNLVKLIGEEVSASGVSAALTDVNKHFITGNPAATGSSNGDVTAAVKASFGTATEVDLAFSNTLPGNKVIIRVTGKSAANGSDAELLSAIRRTRSVFSNVSDKPKEVNGEGTETLTSSQVSSVCQDVIDICDNIYDFKTGWENRDKSQAKLISAIDKAFADVVKDKDVDAKVQRLARGVAGAATDIVRRDSTFKASFVSYAMSVSNGALSYCERSFAQYKK